MFIQKIKNHLTISNIIIFTLSGILGFLIMDGGINRMNSRPNHLKPQQEQQKNLKRELDEKVISLNNPDEIACCREVVTRVNKNPEKTRVSTYDKYILKSLCKPQTNKYSSPNTAKIVADKHCVTAPNEKCGDMKKSDAFAYASLHKNGSGAAVHSAFCENGLWKLKTGSISQWSATLRILPDGKVKVLDSHHFPF